MRWADSTWFKHIGAVVAPVLFFCIIQFLSPSAYAQEDSWLASTVDANFEDRFIQEKLAEIGPGVEAAFAFVRDQIGFEVYTGSLRGARGTLWSAAGNSLDQANLLIALLRAQGIPARYVRGALSDEDAKILIASMFDPELLAQAVGFIPEEFERADPVNDLELISEVSKHWWVELQDGTQLDPSFRDGTPRGIIISRHSEVPKNLRHQVAVRLKIEFNNILSGFTEQTPLERLFTTAEVYGKPLTIGHFINADDAIGLVGIGHRTFTYSPYILVGDNDSSFENDEVIRGNDYQEFFSTLFPLADSFLTRARVEIEIFSPGKSPETFSRNLLDRVGFAARNGIAQPKNFDSDNFAITDLDLLTINIVSGLFNTSILDKQSEAMLSISDEMDMIFSQLGIISGIDPALYTDEEFDLINRSSIFLIKLRTLTTRILNSFFLLLSDGFTNESSAQHLVKTYFDSPRIILTFNTFSIESGDFVRHRIGVDLRKNNIRSIAYPGQNSVTPTLYNVARGIEQNLLESLAVEKAFDAGVQGTLSFSTVDIFEAANKAGIGSRTLFGEKDILRQLAKLNLSAEAKARITQALRESKSITVPVEMINLGTRQTIGWYETNPTTGYLLGVLEDGGHQSAVEYLQVLRARTSGSAQIVSKYGEVIAKYPELWNLPIRELSKRLANKILQEAVAGGISAETQAAAYQLFGDSGLSNIHLLVNIALSTPIQTRDATNRFISAFPVGSIIEVPDTDLEVISLYRSAPISGTGIVTSSAGIILEIIPDETFAVKTNGAQILSGFRVRITNSSGNSQFTLEGTAPPDWNFLVSRQGISIANKGSGQASVFLQPRDDTSSLVPGTPVPFSITVARNDDPATRLTQELTFVVPEISGLAIQANPEVLHVTPNGTVQASFSFTNVGNVPATVNLAVETPSGFMATGLDPGLSLAPGESNAQTLTLTVPELPLNSDHFVRVIAAAGNSGEPTQELNLRIRIVDLVALTTLDAANAADGVGRPELGDTLKLLGQTLTDLAQDPSNEILQSRVTALLDSLIAQLNAPALTPFILDITAARDAIASGTDIPGTLDDLSNIFGDLDNTLRTDPDALPFELTLQPNSTTALPNTPTRFNVFLQNNRQQATTFNLDLSDLPPSVTGELNQTSITLAPGEATSVEGGPQVFVTLTQSTQELIAFDFSVTASIADSPDISRTAQGAFTVRDELIKVVSVDTNPGFTDPGGQVNVSTRLLNAVNRSFPALVSFTVKDPAGTAVFASTPQEVALTVLSSLDTVDLGVLDTSGFSLGTHTLEVTVTDPDGVPIPGAMGEGSLLIGSPVSARMTAEPGVLPTGDGTVAVSLSVNSTIDLPAPKIRLLSLTDTDANASSLAIRNNLAYVCGTENVTIFDISDPVNPQILDTFAEDLIVNSTTTKCRIVDNHLVVIWQVSRNTESLPVLVFNLADPTAPSLISNTTQNRRFINSLFFIDRTAFGAFGGVIFFFGFLLGDQFGDFVAFDFSDFENPQFLDALFGSNNPPNGGKSLVWQGVPVNDGLALVATSTSTGGSTAGVGVGRVLSVDISNPADLAILNTLDVPGTVHITGIEVQGHVALAVGNTGGITTQAINGEFPLVGNVTLTALDISDPVRPRIIQTITTGGTTDGRTTVNSIGNGFFAVSGVQLDNQPVLMVVDTNAPQDIFFTTIDVPADISESLVLGNNLFTPSSAGLGIYDIGDAVGTRITARVRIPKNLGVNRIPDSFNIEPTEIISDVGFDTLIWDRALTPRRLGETFTWQVGIDDIQPGEARAVTLDSTIDFTVSTGDTGQIELPPLQVVSEQILSLTPASQTVNVGDPAGYTLTLANPTDSTVTYTLSVLGVPQAWVNLVSPITVPAQGSVDQALTLQSDPQATPSENGFVVTANAATGVQGFVNGTLILEATPGGPVDVGEDVESAALGVVATLAPAQATAGQGTVANFRVRLINTGNVTDRYDLSASLPGGFTGVFDQQTVEVPPGLDNFREVQLTVTPAPGTAPGNQPFTVTATSTAEGSVSDQASATLTITANGVDVTVSPTSGSPDTAFQLTVTNTGQVEDTLDLAVGGPLGPLATLGMEVLTLDPGVSQAVLITLEDIDFAFPGNLNLIAVATSRANTAVRDSATAQVTIPATQGVTVDFDPAAVVLDTLGSAQSLLIVQNKGNTEGAYRADITGTSGLVTGKLQGLDGQPTEAIPTFRLPGLSTGAILLNANIPDFGQGSVTAQVNSQSDPQVQDDATFNLSTSNQPPQADAGVDQTVSLGHAVMLNGQGSTDPDNKPEPLSFQWQFVLPPPPGSQLTNADINDADQAQATFTPDAAGEYVVEITVSDGAATAVDQVVITVEDTPIAKAGPDQNVKTGTPITLDGSGSFSPREELITFDWQLQDKPPASALTNADLTGADIPNPTFTPDVDGSYTFSLQVQDSQQISAPDTVTIIAFSDNVPPNARAGADQNALVGTPILLDGRASFDPDNGPQSLIYRWTLTGRPAESNLDNASILDAEQPQASFTADAYGDYVLNLHITDGQAGDDDQVTVAVTLPNVAPNAVAGDDQRITLGETASLSGEASDDPDNGALAFTWRFVYLPTSSRLSNADIVDASTATPGFTPDVEGSYVLRLEISDGEAKTLGVS